MYGKDEFGIHETDECQRGAGSVVGAGPMPRSEVVKALWVYIKKNNLQNPTNKRNILADENLKAVFDGKAEVTMFEMTKLVSKHLS